MLPERKSDYFDFQGREYGVGVNVDAVVCPKSVRGSVGRDSVVPEEGEGKHIRAQQQKKRKL